MSRGADRELEREIATRDLFLLRVAQKLAAQVAPSVRRSVRADGEACRDAETRATISLPFEATRGEPSRFLVKLTRLKSGAR